MIILGCAVFYIEWIVTVSLHEKLQFMRLICSRMCHDLINSSSSIEFTMDLLDQSHINNESYLLSKQSINNLNTKLRLFRQAFGFNTSNKSSYPKGLEDMISQFFIDKDCTIIWKNKLPEEINSESIKAICILFIFIHSIASNNLDIFIFSNVIENNYIGLALEIKGNEITIPENHKYIIENDIEQISLDDITPRNITTYILMLSIHILGGHFEIEEGSVLRLSCMLPK